MPTAANRFDLDYLAEAVRLGPPATPIFDAHLHINGPEAMKVFKRAADAFGVTHFLTQSRIEHADAIREVFGDRAHFVAVPEWQNPDKCLGFGELFLKNLDIWRHRYGARVVKLWNAPRLREMIPPERHAEFIDFDAPWRVRVAERAAALGMMFKAHVADPDTWFRTKYADASKYGTKPRAYESLERMLDRFPQTWILAHMGGWPEDLDFLDGLLSRHPNAVLDTSATKWIVREISAHPRERVVEFVRRWSGRILFGSDIVTTDEHLTPRPAGGKAHPMAELADSPAAAFDLYASRYYALRTMWETASDGESPIADPDLMMVEPARHGPMSAPRLRGLSLPADLLRTLYRGAVERVLGLTRAG